MLSPWGPAELLFDPAPAELERLLRDNHGWTGPHWALLAGQALLACGDSAPSARDMAQRLAGEIMDAARNEGATVKKREETHKMAEAHRAIPPHSW